MQVSVLGLEHLSDDNITEILQFVGKKSYIQCGTLNKRCREIYLSQKGFSKETFLYGYAPLPMIIKAYEKECLRLWGASKYLAKGVVYHQRRDILLWTLQKQDRDALYNITDIAAGAGRLRFLKEVVEYFNQKVMANIQRISIERGDGICYHAAYNGHLNICQWMKIHEFSFFSERQCATGAAEGNHIKLLEWLKDSNYKFDENVCKYAAKGGHLHIIKWLRNNACPWKESTFEYAAGTGNLDLLQWLKQKRCPWDGYSYIRASEEGHLHVLNWLRDAGCPLDISVLYIYGDEFKDKTEIEEWLRDHGVELVHNGVDYF